MKVITLNSYIKTFKFKLLQEVLFFISNKSNKNHLLIDDTFGDNYYCYVFCHSLTKEEQFIISFSSDESEDNLNLLYWGDLLVLDTAKNIYLIDQNLSIRASLDITTPLIGLYLINMEKLLVLEETYMRIINNKGEVLKTELFELIEKFSIKNNLLSIQTSTTNKVIELT